MKSTSFIHFSLAVLLMLALAVAYAVWFFETRRVIEETALLEAEIAQKHDEQLRLASGRDALAALEEDERQINSHFVPTDNIVSFLEEVESVGDAFGADVVVLSVTDTEDGTLSLSLSLSGTFNAVMKTLGVLEYGTYGSATHNLTLDAAPDGLFTAALTLLVSVPKTP